MEHRRYPRFAVHIPVAFWAKDTEGRGEIFNIAMGGCAILSDVAPAPATYLKLALVLPDTRGTLIVDLAPVRWSSDRRFGVEFVRMEPAAQADLRRFLGGFHPGAS